MPRPRTGYLLRRARGQYLSLNDPTARHAPIYHVINVDGRKYALSLRTSDPKEARAIVQQHDTDFAEGNHQAYFDRIRQRAGLNPRSKDYEDRLRDMVAMGRMAERELKARRKLP